MSEAHFKCMRCGEVGLYYSFPPNEVGTIRGNCRYCKRENVGMWPFEVGQPDRFYDLALEADAEYVIAKALSISEGDLLTAAIDRALDRNDAEAFYRLSTYKRF